MKLFKHLTAAAVVSAALLTAPGAMAANILIDSFDDFDAVFDVPTGGNVNDSTLNPAPNVLGNARRLTIATTSNTPLGNANAANNTVSLVSTGTPPGLLRFSNAAGFTGVATVSYGVAATGAILGDLTGGGTNDRFLFTEISGDLSVPELKIKVTDTSNVEVEIIDNLLGVTTAFSKFTDVNAALDFENIASLVFTLSATNPFDGAVGSISAIPLPASTWLLICGLGGLVGARSISKRRRAA